MQTHYMLIAALGAVLATAFYSKISSNWRWKRGSLAGLIVGISILAILVAFEKTGVAHIEAHVVTASNSEDANRNTAPPHVADTSVAKPRIVDSQANDEHKAIVDSALSSPQSAYELSKNLFQCSQLDRLLDEHKYLPSRLTAEQFDSATEQLVMLSEQCEPILGISDKTAYELVRYSAESGNIEAQIYFPALAAQYIRSSEENSLNEDLLRSFKNESVKFAVQAAQTGDSRALYHAYTVFRDGIFTFTDPDLTRSHRYLSEYLKLKSSPRLQEELRIMSSEMKAGS